MNKQDTIIKKLDAILDLLESQPKPVVPLNKKTYNRSVIHGRIREGVRLIAIKGVTRHAGFEARLMDEEIPFRLANKLMQVARVFLDETKLQQPSLDSLESWNRNPEVVDCINSFIGESKSWKEILRSRHISV